MEKEKEAKDLLEDELKTEFEKLSSMTPGTREHSAAVDSLATLYKLSIDETENDRAFRERCDKDIAMSKELQLKEAQLEEQKKDRYFRLALESAGLILPLIFYGIWMRKGFKFEQEGTFTSTTFRGLINRFRPTRK